MFNNSSDSGWNEDKMLKGVGFGKTSFEKQATTEMAFKGDDCECKTEESSLVFSYQVHATRWDLGKKKRRGWYSHRKYRKGNK